ncbi:ClpP/crotonase-like domain-containing protein [Linnemannia elongata]|nr:ClpP/crotonase-like domain-containing protein [Linnemannia elongata]
MLRTFFARSRQPQRILTRAVAPSAPSGFRFIATTSQPAAHPEGKECYLERLTGDDQGIAVLNFNRPKAFNALSRKFVGEFRDALQELRYDNDARVVIIRSLVDGAFCAGADLRERATMNMTEVRQFLTSLRDSFRELETLPIPTIAVIDGAALGGGLEMALCCDMRVGGGNKKVKIGLVETKLAIIPGAGGTQRLPRLIGIPKAKELIYSSKILNSAAAKEIGILNHAVTEDSGYNKALEVAREILPMGPLAIRMAKSAIDKGTQFEIDSGLEYEQACYAQIMPSEDRLEGLASFREKRKPVYKGK